VLFDADWIVYVGDVKLVSIFAAWKTSRQNHEVFEKALIQLLPLANRTSTYACDAAGACVDTGIKVVTCITDTCLIKT
jgi:hypothetical protein